MENILPFILQQGYSYITDVLPVQNHECKTSKEDELNENFPFVTDMFKASPYFSLLRESLLTVQFCSSRACITLVVPHLQGNGVGPGLLMPGHRKFVMCLI